ncbi:hypothetical protein F2P81_001961 [Scophthalmus maximus]|uniref:Uncharacterized protein n=1 Tax=Scophthalmus maximus TaxID=52904 RepID=A0A6A4TTU4_SCOMX|nr:hypothetical protein F2P81_001961 [Scophthalmus maximus]
MQTAPFVRRRSRPNHTHRAGEWDAERTCRWHQGGHRNVWLQLSHTFANTERREQKPTHVSSGEEEAVENSPEQSTIYSLFKSAVTSNRDDSNDQNLQICTSHSSSSLFR